MYTVSRKIERLINLTIALLATRRFLTKNEILRSVDGYEGSDETKERMFERDKDGLRNLGIVIEVGGFDPLFEDEAGYRIKPEEYSLDLGNITGTEIALLSLAGQAWRGAALDVAAQSALTKLHSMGIQSDLDSVPAIAPRLNTSGGDFHSITTAISERCTISFTYLSPSLARENRAVAPYAIATRNSHWYVAGRDLAKNGVRTFRFDRIEGEITINRSGGGYEIPTGFDLFAALDNEQSIHIATVDIRKGKAHVLRNSAITASDKGEWDRITVNYLDEQRFIDLILWHGEDVLVIAPIKLRAGIISALQEIVRHHA